MNPIPDKDNQKVTKAVKGVKKEDKNGRAQSEKEPVKSANESIKAKPEKASKYKRNT
jgi:hypothetical protein